MSNEENNINNNKDEQLYLKNQISYENEKEENNNINNEEIKEKIKIEINNEENKEDNKKEEEVNINNENNVPQIKNKNEIIEEEQKEEKNQILLSNDNDNMINIDKEKEKDIIENVEIKDNNNENKIEEVKNFNAGERISIDILTKKFEAKNDDDKYLVQLDEDKELENLINEHNNNSSDEDDEEEETFPFRIIGDVQKKGETLGKFNHRYLEIDSVKGILKRYKSSKE